MTLLKLPAATGKEEQVTSWNRRIEKEYTSAAQPSYHLAIGKRRQSKGYPATRDARKPLASTIQ